MQNSTVEEQLVKLATPILQIIEASVRSFFLVMSPEFEQRAYHQQQHKFVAELVSCSDFAAIKDCDFFPERFPATYTVLMLRTALRAIGHWREMENQSQRKFQLQNMATALQIYDTEEMNVLVEKLLSIRSDADGIGELRPFIVAAANALPFDFDEKSRPSLERLRSVACVVPQPQLKEPPRAEDVKKHPQRLLQQQSQPKADAAAFAKPALKQQHPLKKNKKNVAFEDDDDDDDDDDDATDDDSGADLSLGTLIELRNKNGPLKNGPLRRNRPADHPNDLVGPSRPNNYNFGGDGIPTMNKKPVGGGGGLGFASALRSDRDSGFSAADAAAMAMMPERYQPKPKQQQANDKIFGVFDDDSGDDADDPFGGLLNPRRKNPVAKAASAGAAAAGAQQPAAGAAKKPAGKKGKKGVLDPNGGPKCASKYHTRYGQAGAHASSACKFCTRCHMMEMLFNDNRMNCTYKHHPRSDSHIKLHLGSSTTGAKADRVMVGAKSVMKLALERYADHKKGIALRPIDIPL